MTPILELRSPRLRLRQWRDADLDAFSAMCADEQVMRHLPALLSRLESAALIGRIRGHFNEYGYGFWALEHTGSGAFIGLAGLAHVGFEAPFAPAVEIGWRLASEHWGLGYASEAAVACLSAAFGKLELDEVVSFTAHSNLPSEKVMQALGMARDPEGDFDHPGLPDGHPLQRHLLYRISRGQWGETMGYDGNFLPLPGSAP